MYVRTVVHSLPKCYTQLFGSPPKYAHKKKNMKNKCLFFFSNKVTARQGMTLGFAYLMPDCWLDVTFHPEGPAID
jgi:hypothetical protein